MPDVSLNSASNSISTWVNRMDGTYNNFDREPSEEELVLISNLSDIQISEVDQGLLSVIDDRFVKVATLVARAKISVQPELLHFPDSFFTGRIALLVSGGILESRGDLKSMRSSEVRLKK